VRWRDESENLEMTSVVVLGCFSRPQTGEGRRQGGRRIGRLASEQAVSGERSENVFAPDRQQCS
jgi:hypothetical protein